MDIKSLFIGFLLGVIGAFFGSLFSYLFSERRRRNEEFNKAASKFRNAFLPEIIFLKHNARISSAGSSDNLQEFLLFGYTRRHLKALVAFKPYLAPKKKKGIDQAWQEYCCNPDKLDELYFQQYSYKSTERETIGEQCKQLALERIEKILEFSKHK